MSAKSRLFRPLRSLQEYYWGHPLRVGLAAVKTFFIAHLLMEYGFEAAPSWGASMLPTFPIMGNVTIQSKRYRRGRGIEVGDIVAYYKPSEPGEKVIKRVIGLEGDYVLRNTPGSGSDQMIQVPEGHFWAVGDNLADSLDSRVGGPVPLALIRGKVIAKVLPWSERKWVENGLQPVVS